MCRKELEFRLIAILRKDLRGVDRVRTLLDRTGDLIELLVREVGLVDPSIFCHQVLVADNLDFLGILEVRLCIRTGQQGDQLTAVLWANTVLNHRGPGQGIRDDALVSRAITLLRIM